MITAVDSSVLLAVLVAGSEHGERSFRALEEARRRGRTVACPIVWAEVAGVFDSRDDVSMVETAGIEFDPFDRDTAELAGRLWRAYRRRGGRRTRIIADFLIAAHAQVRADGLLTRDRGFGKRYFADVNLIEP